MTGESIDTIVVFAAIGVNVALALRPISFTAGKRRITIGIVISAPATLALLYALGVLNASTMWRGLAGTGSLVPVEIIAIFFGTAYVSVSTDNTGVFDMLAYRIVRSAKGNGRRLFLLFYLFSSLLTLFTSNDIVILTLTPIIFYLGRHADIDVIPYLFAEFFAANTTSMLLYIGNPTNIIIGNALKLGFWQFSAVMWLPTLVASATTYALLLIIFRNRIPRAYAVNQASAYYMRSSADAGSSVAVLLVMLLMLAFSGVLHLAIWEITTVCAVGQIARDLLFDGFENRGNAAARAAAVARKIPWTILPFIVLFFVLVQRLTETGFVDALASLFSRFNSPILAAATFGFSSLVAANLMNNQPMSILYAHILMNGHLLLRGATATVAAYAVVIASNLGANLTVVGALAGMMWKRILAQKSIRIGFADFLAIGAAITPAVAALAFLALLLTA
ncbi:MAG TPA: SLC13 family permease [Spirochaetia bacterium]|nr:SLC13 family permease [Spirochaetia bacterium]